jgi:hypothetical protein
MLTISKTALETYLSGCSWRYQLYKRYTRLKVSPAETFGIAVHQLMQHGLPPAGSEPTVDLDAYEVARKLFLLENNLGYKILGREVKHFGLLVPDIQVFGIIDAVAELNGEPVLIDYKTSSRAWKEVVGAGGEIIVAKSRGFQGPIYLTPPREYKYFTGKSWAKQLHYLIAPENGVTAVHIFSENDADRRNLIQAAQMLKRAVDAGEFPLNEGWLCDSCEWLHACRQTPKWQQYHGEKK